MIRIKADVVKEFFNVSVKSVLDHVATVLKDLQSNCATILMVGAFSESVMLHENVQLTFPNMTFIIPGEAGVAVLKGAVIFGHFKSRGRRQGKFLWKELISLLINQCLLNTVAAVQNIPAVVYSKYQFKKMIHYDCCVYRRTQL